MLKTTYKPAAGSSQALPPGWTEHKAPSGHLYYYHAESKKSTYTRPTLPAAQIPEALPNPIPNILNGYDDQRAEAQNLPPLQHAFPAQKPDQGRPGGYSRQQRQDHRQKPQPQDRPKHRQVIPGAAPWILVKTKLRRRFVHNTETGESLWKFPQDVMKCVVELDRVDRERKARHAEGNFSHQEEDEKVFVPEKSGDNKPDNGEYDSDEYEEVEVSEDDEQDEREAKRPRADDQTQGPVEFNEDDIAFQLAQLEQMAGDEAGDIHYEYEEAPALAEEDARALFMDLLNDHNISPFTPWDKIIDEGIIIDDDRYTVLPNMKSRKDTFDEWSRVKVQELKKIREEQAQSDPRVPYIAFLDKHASTKLYWPEFRRKYQKEPELKDRKLSDKDREKWYREHISRLKLPESKLKADLTELLKSIPLRDLNRSTSMSALPSGLLRDIRYISLSPRKRDPLVEAFIATAAHAPDGVDELSPEEEARRDKDRVERERRERALAKRIDAVREQKAKQRRNLGYSKALLHEEEAEIDKAMKVGKEGLMGYMGGGED